MNELRAAEWRYLPRGRVQHALVDDDANATQARCGIEVFYLSQWYGTGSQDEYDHAATLPKCQRCARAEP